jgi:hypothetical protein
LLGRYFLFALALDGGFKALQALPIQGGVHRYFVQSSLERRTFLDELLKSRVDCESVRLRWLLLYLRLYWEF